MTAVSSDPHAQAASLQSSSRRHDQAPRSTYATKSSCADSKPHRRGSSRLCDRIKNVVCSLCCRTRTQPERQRRPLLGPDSPADRASDPVRDHQAASEWTTALEHPADEDGPRRRRRKRNDPAMLRARPVWVRSHSYSEDTTSTTTPRRIPSAQVDPASWMASLPDHVQLETVYLPGTHQSLARNYPFASSLCQTTSLTHQLTHGIRALDLRFSLREEDGTLWAYHGPVPQGREMAEVFEEIYRFLESEEGRRETVLVSLKQENAAHGFAGAVWNLIDSTRPTMWYDRNVWPTLDQVRGRCVMFCRFGFQSGRGLHPPIWPNDKRYLWKTEIGGRETVVQDWYGVRSPLSLPEKAELALSLFDPTSPAMLALDSTSKASSRFVFPREDEPPPIPYRINFLSCGSFPTLYPSHAAKGFGAPKFGVGYRGVNALVASGLEAQRRGMIEAEGFAFSDMTVPEPTRPAPDGRTHESDGFSSDSTLLPRIAIGPEDEKPSPLRSQAPSPQLLPPADLSIREASPTLYGQQRRDGHGGMLVFLDFWESPRKVKLVDQIIEMNF